MTPDPAATDLADVMRDTPGTDPATATDTLDRMADTAARPHTPAELNTYGTSAQQCAGQLADAIRDLQHTHTD